MSPISYSIASLFKRIFVILFSVVYSGGKIDSEKIIGVLLTFFGLYMYDLNSKEISNGERKIAAMQEQEVDETLPIHTHK
jgi:solute carrier family 35 protein E1